MLFWNYESMVFGKYSRKENDLSPKALKEYNLPLT